MINETTLGPLALLLAVNAPEIFELNNFRLANLIDEQTLNSVMPDGKYKGSSLAWWLLDQPEILRANGSRLEKLIDKESLNEVKKQLGESPASLRAQLEPSREKPRSSTRP